MSISTLYGDYQMKHIHSAIVSTFEIILVFFVLSITGTLFAQETKSNSNDCASLADFRDKKLFKEWDKARVKYQLSAQARDDLKKIREELLDDNTWSTSDWSVTVGIVAANLKATANLVSNVLDLNPATGAVKGTVQTGKVTTEKVLEMLESGQKIQSVADGELKKVIAKEFLTRINPVGKGVKAVWELSEDVKEMTYLKSEQDELKAIIKERLDALDEQINNYELQMEESKEKMQAINEIKEAIDSYCLKHRNQ